MDLRDIKEMEKDLKSYEKEMNALDMKMFLAKIGTISLVSIAAIVGLIVGNITSDLLRWMTVSIASGGALSIPLITEYIKANEIYHINKKEINILKDKIDKEKRGNKEQTVEKVKITNKANNYSYNNMKKNITYTDTERMFEIFNEKIEEKEPKTSKKR